MCINPNNNMHHNQTESHPSSMHSIPMLPKKYNSISKNPHKDHSIALHMHHHHDHPFNNHY